MLKAALRCGLKNVYIEFFLSCDVMLAIYLVKVKLSQLQFNHDIRLVALQLLNDKAEAAIANVQTY